MSHSFEDLLELGVYEFAGFDSEEPVYVMNMEKAQEHVPELYWNEINAIQTAVFDAVNEGYLEWEVDPTTLDESLIVTKRGEEVI